MLPLIGLAVAIGGQMLSAKGARQEARRRERKLRKYQVDSAALEGERQDQVKGEQSQRDADLSRFIDAMGSSDTGQAKDWGAGVMAEADRLNTPQPAAAGDPNDAFGNLMQARAATRAGHAATKRKATSAALNLKGLDATRANGMEDRQMSAAVRSRPFAKAMADNEYRQEQLRRLLAQDLGDYSRGAANMQLAGQGAQAVGQMGMSFAGSMA